MSPSAAVAELSHALLQSCACQRDAPQIIFFSCVAGGLPSHTGGHGFRTVTPGLQRALDELATLRCHGAVVGIVA